MSKLPRTRPPIPKPVPEQIDHEPIPVAAPQTAPPLAAIEEEAPMADATNEPPDYVFIPGKGHTSAHILEYMTLIVFRMMNVPPPPKGSMRYPQITEDYAQALSPEASQWLRQVPRNPTPEEEMLTKMVGLPLPNLLGPKETQ